MHRPGANDQPEDRRAQQREQAGGAHRPRRALAAPARHRRASEHRGRAGELRARSSLGARQGRAGRALAIPRLREDHRCRRKDIAAYLKNVAEMIHPASDLSTDSTGIQMHDGGGVLHV